VSPSLGAARPIATQLDRRGVTLAGVGCARGETLSRTRGGSLGSIGYPVVPRGFSRRHEDACVTRPPKGASVRARIESPWVCPRVVWCVAEVGRRCSDPKKRSHGTFLTKCRTGVAGGLARSFSRGERAERHGRRRRRRVKRHREPDRGGKAAGPGKGKARGASTAVTRRAPCYAGPSYRPMKGAPGRGGRALFTKARTKRSLRPRTKRCVRKRQRFSDGEATGVSEATVLRRRNGAKNSTVE